MTTHYPPFHGTQRGIVNLCAYASSWYPGTCVHDVRQYGAKGDGITDDTVAIQTACNAAKGTATGSGYALLADTGTVYFPSGVYMISSPIIVYSGTQLIGCAAAASGSSVIKESATFIGTTLIQIDDLVPDPGPHIVDRIEIGYLEFAAYNTTTTTWAIQPPASHPVINCFFHDLQITTQYGIELSYYAQSMLIKNIYSYYAGLRQILKLGGNRNRIEDIDVELSADNGTDPIVYFKAKEWGGVTNSVGNELHNLLIEGTTCPNKDELLIERQSYFVLDGYWTEPVTNNGYALHVKDCDVEVIFQGYFNNPYTGATATYWNIDNVEHLYVENFYYTGSVSPLTVIQFADALSYIELNTYTCSALIRDVGQFMNNPQIKVNNVVAWYAIALAKQNLNPNVDVNLLSANNILTNGSLEAGRYGWTFINDAGGAANPDTESYEASEVNMGLMGRFVWLASDNYILRQRPTAPAVWAGQWFTFSCKVKITTSGADTNCFVYPYITGAGGLAHTSGDITRAYIEQGWQKLAITFKVLAAGTLTVGLFLAGSTATVTWYVDDCILSYGMETTAGTGMLGSLELRNSTTLVTGNTITCGTSAPADGTWKVGDIVFDSVPVSGQPMGWMCTVAGTPGTWVAMANLA